MTETASATNRTPTDPTGDATIVAWSVADPPAFAAIFDRHWPAVHRFCTTRAGTAGEDIAAEVFRIAFDDRRRFDGRTVSTRPWLFGIATNLVRNHFRVAERARRAVKRVGPVDTTATDSDDDALSRIEAQLLGPQLASALGALPAADRDALVLLAWADLSYEEIAEALGIPIGTVRSRIHRARTRVRAYLITTEDFQ